jgi:hypothetical protein
MDSGFFDDGIIETIESLGCSYLIKAKEYPTLVSQLINPDIIFVTGDEGRETTELLMKQITWDKDRRFVISRVLKPEIIKSTIISPGRWRIRVLFVRNQYRTTLRKSGHFL